MQLCGQALRFFTGLQPLIKRVTTDYIRSMCSHDITQTFLSETRHSLLHKARLSVCVVVVFSSPSPPEFEFPKAKTDAQLPTVKTTVFGVCDLQSVWGLWVLNILLSFLLATISDIVEQRLAILLYFRFYAEQKYSYMNIRGWQLRPHTMMHKHVSQITTCFPRSPASHILPGLIYNAKVMMSGRVSRPKKRD